MLKSNNTRGIVIEQEMHCILTIAVRVSDCNGISTHSHLVRKQTLNHLLLNALVFVYELNGRGFESLCSHLSFRYRACFEQGVPLEIQAIVECRFTIKTICDILRTRSQAIRSKE